MTTTASTRFLVQAIPAEVLAGVRASGIDVSGNPIEHVTAEGGEPLRCCLRSAEPGERAILFGYEPPLPASPYRELGAVYTHAEPCAGIADADTYPTDFYGRPQVLRAYDERGWIYDGRLHDGQDPESVIADVLADPAVAQIHSRNVGWGCYMFAIIRAD